MESFTQKYKNYQKALEFLDQMQTQTGVDTLFFFVVGDKARVFVCTQTNVIINITGRIAVLLSIGTLDSQDISLGLNFGDETNEQRATKILDKFNEVLKQEHVNRDYHFAFQPYKLKLL